jgi:hypothetical protein
MRKLITYYHHAFIALSGRDISSTNKNDSGGDVRNSGLNRESRVNFNGRIVAMLGDNGEK